MTRTSLILFYVDCQESRPNNSAQLPVNSETWLSDIFMSLLIAHGDTDFFPGSSSCHLLRVSGNRVFSVAHLVVENVYTLQCLEK